MINSKQFFASIIQYEAFAKWKQFYFVIIYVTKHYLRSAHTNFQSVRNIHLQQASRGRSRRIVQGERRNIQLDILEFSFSVVCLKTTTFGFGLAACRTYSGGNHQPVVYCI